MRYRRKEQSNDYLWPLVVKAKDGDQDAFNEIVVALDPVINRIVNRHMAPGFEREVLQQGALIGLWRAIGLWRLSHPKSIAYGDRSFVFYCQPRISNEVRKAARSMAPIHVPRRLNDEVAARAKELGVRTWELNDADLTNIREAGDAHAAARARHRTVNYDSKAVQARLERLEWQDPTEFGDETVLRFLEVLRTLPEDKREGAIWDFMDEWGLDLDPDTFLEALK